MTLDGLDIAVRFCKRVQVVPTIAAPLYQRSMHSMAGMSMVGHVVKLAVHLR